MFIIPVCMNKSYIINQLFAYLSVSVYATLYFFHEKVLRQKSKRIKHLERPLAH